MPAMVLTRSASSGSNIPGSVTTNITIDPSQTIVVDSCPTIISSSIKWFYTLIDAVDNKVLTAEVLATHRSGANPTHNRYGIIGDSILHQALVNIIASNIGLQITNLSLNTITVNIVRIQIPA